MSPRKASAARSQGTEGAAAMQTHDKCGLLTHSISRYFSQRPNALQLMVPYIQCTAGVSLRLIDWFVTSYCKRNDVVVKGTDNALVNVHLSYRQQLKSYSKQLFDPFRRRDRIIYHIGSASGGGGELALETTVGQLNFFRWLLTNNILQYIEAHAAALNREMVLENGGTPEEALGDPKALGDSVPDPKAGGGSVRSSPSPPPAPRPPPARRAASRSPPAPRPSAARRASRSPPAAAAARPPASPAAAAAARPPPRPSSRPSSRPRAAPPRARPGQPGQPGQPTAAASPAFGSGTESPRAFGSGTESPRATAGPEPKPRPEPQPRDRAHGGAASQRRAQAARPPCMSGPRTVRFD